MTMDISKLSEKEIAELQAQLDARRDSERRRRAEDDGADGREVR